MPTQNAEGLMSKLGMALLAAESEEAIAGIVASAEFQSLGLSIPTNWRPLDDRDTNFNVVTNQAASGGKAATELVTNMVDAMLTKRCLEEGISPKGDKAPQTMYEAVDRFITQLNGGKISKADNTWRRRYASENLVIGITGKTRGGKPCYTFADNGEGQDPSDFPKTFLSFSTKNKSAIPFVQGKYNMGSSGVLNFCGTRWYKLIVSRRYDKKGKWGWTLIRKNAAKTGPFAEYFAPNEGQIPTLGDVIRVYPFHKNGKRFEKFSLESGTIVKLYDFFAGKDFGSGFRGAREAFNENLVETILPFQILDFRYPPTKGKGELRALGVDERRFYGMEFLLLNTHSEGEDEGEEVEGKHGDVKSVGVLDSEQLGKITVSAIVLKQDSAKKTKWYRKSLSRIFHHVNGQVQYKQKRGVLSQWGFSALQNRVVILVDASNLKDEAHQELWKGDREVIRQTVVGEQYLDAVAGFIKDSPMLKELNHQIAREECDSAAQESSKELIEELVSRDKNLALLLDGKSLGIPTHSTVIPEPKILVEHKHNPTFIRLERNKDKNFALPINRQRSVPFITDAPQNYFTRADNRGRLFFEDDSILNSFEFEAYPSDTGRLLIVIRSIAEEQTVGKEYLIKIGLIDDGMPESVCADPIKITIAGQKAPSPGPDVPPRPPRPLPSSKGLPSYKLVTKNGRGIPEISEESTVEWKDTEFDDFNQQDGGYVLDMGESIVYYINFDNGPFQAYLGRLKKNEGAIAVATQKYILGMRIAMLGAESALKAKSTDSEADFDQLDFRRMAARGAAAVILTLCEELPRSFELSGNEGSEE